MKPVRAAGRLALFALGYVALFQIGMYFYFEPESVATFWPANGLVVGALLLCATRSWPALIAVQAGVQLALDLYQLGNPLSFAVFATLANTLAVVVVAALVRGACGPRFSVARLRDVIILVVAALLGEGLGACAGARAVLYAHRFADFWSVWKVWWFADLIGVLLVTPVVVAWAELAAERPPRPAWPRLAEGVALFAALTSVSWVVFSTGAGASSWFFNSPYMVAPLLLWGALRFRPAIAYSAVLIVAVILLIHADRGQGPFVLPEQTTHQLALAVQAFLSFGSLTTAVVAAVLSERRRAESELAQREARFRSLIEQAADAIFVHDAEGRIVEVNNRAVESLGYSRAELRKMNVMDVDVTFADADLARARELWAGLDVDAAATIHGEHRRKDGTMFPVEVRVGVIEAGTQPLFVALARDISDRKRQEEERLGMERWLAQSQRMEALGTLAGGIAHDFNNILSAIVGYSELAQGMLEKGAARDCLEQVSVAAARATELVRQILAFSRPAEPRLELVRPHLLVKEALRLLRASMPRTIEIRPRIDPQCGVIAAAPEQVHQIVMNLCTNAYQAMRETGGILEVSLEPVEIDSIPMGRPAELAAGPYVCLTVRDNGPGMAGEVLSRAFEPFFTTKPIGEGTGMGLAVVHGTARTLGGTVTVSSTPQVETVFSVYLPRLDVEPEGTPVATPVIVGGSERILLVDDEPALVELATRFLRPLGYDVMAVHSGAEALARFERAPNEVDLVITDQTMPGVTGAELARRALELRPDLPVILCTGHSDVIDAAGAAALGIRIFLEKPITRSRLASAIREALS